MHSESQLWSWYQNYVSNDVLTKKPKALVNVGCTSTGNVIVIEDRTNSKPLGCDQLIN
jgi:hypothetical protein